MPRNVYQMEDKNILSLGAPIPVFILLQYLNAHGFLTHNVGHYLGDKKNALELNKSLVCLSRLINESRSRV